MTGEVTEMIADFTISAVFEELPLAVVERANFISSILSAS